MTSSRKNPIKTKQKPMLSSQPQEDLSHLPEHLRIHVPEPDPKEYERYPEPHRSVMIERRKNNERMAIWARGYHGPLSATYKPPAD